MNPRFALVLVGCWLSMSCAHGVSFDAHERARAQVIDASEQRIAADVDACLRLGEPTACARAKGSWLWRRIHAGEAVAMAVAVWAAGVIATTPRAPCPGLMSCRRR